MGLNFFPKVAVLLAAYNGEKWIEDQLLAIINQKDVDLNVYISLDLSTDNTLDIIARLSKQYPQIRLLPYGIKFGSAAPNFYHLLLNVPVGNYDYIALSDQDDLWLENKLKRAIEVLNEGQASGYSSDFTAFWENGKEKAVKKSYPQCAYDYLFESPGPGCSFVLKKDLALAVRRYLKLSSSLSGLDWHDWLIYAFARANNYKWIIDNTSYILYRQHANNQLGVNLGSMAFSKRVGDIVSGYGIKQSLKIIGFLRMTKSPFVVTWYKDDKIHYLVLAFNANKCRRKRLDKIFFFLACNLMFLLQPQLISDE